MATGNPNDTNNSELNMMPESFSDTLKTITENLTKDTIELGKMKSEKDNKAAIENMSSQTIIKAKQD